METGANNILPKVNYSPKSLDNLLTEKCHLSIEIGRNHFSYTLFDTLTLTYILLKEFEFQAKDFTQSTNKIANIIANEPLLQKEFYSSSLAFNNFPSTLVPTIFYKEKRSREILKFNHEVFEEILTDKMQQIDAINIYSVPTELLNLINNSFQNTQLKSSDSILIDQLLLQNESSEEKVFASIKNNILEVCIIDNNKLKFHNHFAIDTKEDLLYFLLFSMEQLGLSQEKTDLILLDDILKSDEKYDILYKYVRSISFGKRAKNLKYAEHLDSIKPHQYFCLFSQLLCA